MWIIPLAQAPALARSAKLNAEICLVSIYLIIVIGLFLYFIVALVVCAVSTFNSRSWAAYQSCDRSLSSVLICDYHDYAGKNVGGTKQGPNKIDF